MKDARGARRSSAAVIAMLGLAVGLWGCWSYPKNPPLEVVDHARGYRFEQVAGPDVSADETFVILSFSGGGTRAAALSYGVLKYLSEQKIRGGGRDLLDEVDVISSVSGGSFTAAYYGRFGRDRFFREFEEEVLHRKIQRDLALRLIAPWSWPRLLSPNFGRSDLADEYYDKKIFEGTTYADMPRRRPFIILNATDMSLGAQFSFVQEHYDRLCSNLDPVHLSRGVTASSAFPIAFTPLTVSNYHPEQGCGERLPGWVEPALTWKGKERYPRQYQRASNWNSYADPERRFVHLSDGGLADNIGLRGPEWAILADESAWSLASKVNDGLVKRIVVIAVDARPRSSLDSDKKARPPGVVSVLNAAASKPMENYSSDTVVRVRDGFKALDRDALNFVRRRERMEANCAELAARSCEGSASCEETRATECREVFEDPYGGVLPHAALYLVQVKFDLIRKDSLREKVETIPTALQLPEVDIANLVVAAETLLQDSHPFQCLIRALDGTTPPGFDPRRCPTDPPITGGPE